MEPLFKYSLDRLHKRIFLSLYDYRIQKLQAQNITIFKAVGGRLKHIALDPAFPADLQEQTVIVLPHQILRCILLRQLIAFHNRNRNHILCKQLLLYCIFHRINIPFLYQVCGKNVDIQVIPPAVCSNLLHLHALKLQPQLIIHFQGWKNLKKSFTHSSVTTPVSILLTTLLP